MGAAPSFGRRRTPHRLNLPPGSVSVFLAGRDAGSNQRSRRAKAITRDAEQVAVRARDEGFEEA